MFIAPQGKYKVYVFFIIAVLFNDSNNLLLCFNNNNNNNLLISSAQVSTIRFSNARYILDRDKHDVYNTLY